MEAPGRFVGLQNWKKGGRARPKAIFLLLRGCEKCNEKHLGFGKEQTNRQRDPSVFLLDGLQLAVAFPHCPQSA